MITPLKNIYAGDTSVPVEKSKAEIEKLLSRYSASQFASGWTGTTAMIGFVMRGRGIRLLLPLPEKTEKRFTLTPAGRYQRRPEDREKAWEQACRSRWRALLLVIKAKLEAAACGISTFEDEFMAWTVLPGGTTVGDAMRPSIAEAIRTGSPTPLLQLPNS